MSGTPPTGGPARAPSGASPIGAMALPALLEAIAAAEPAPGAGAAGAIALALGVACARKAMRISATHHPGDPLFAAYDGRLAAVGGQAVSAGQADAEAFRGLIAAMRLPHADGDARDAAIAAARDAVTAVGERLVALADAASALLEAVADRIDPVVANDGLAARRLIAAARAIHQANLDEAG